MSELRVNVDFYILFRIWRGYPWDVPFQDILNHVSKYISGIAYAVWAWNMVRARNARTV